MGCIDKPNRKPVRAMAAQGQGQVAMERMVLEETIMDYKKARYKHSYLTQKLSNHKMGAPFIAAVLDPQVPTPAALSGMYEDNDKIRQISFNLAEQLVKILQLRPLAVRIIGEEEVKIIDDKKDTKGKNHANLDYPPGST